VYKGIIASNDDEKAIELPGGGVAIGIGCVTDFEPIIALYFNKPCDKELKYLTGSTLIIIEDNGDVFEFGVMESGEVLTSKIFDSYAWGSGVSFALAALDCGKDAVGAVKIAIGRDMYSGGTIRSINIKTLERKIHD